MEIWHGDLVPRDHSRFEFQVTYTHLSNKRGGWNKRGGGAKVANSLNVEVGIIVEGGIFCKKLIHNSNKRGVEGGFLFCGGWNFSLVRVGPTFIREMRVI